jgi:hypothetical protein
VSEWVSSADLDFRDRNNTNRFVTAQEHPYLTGAYDERMRIIAVIKEYGSEDFTSELIELIQGGNA